ncbi:MAG: hypothetical protein ACE5O2_00730 [Armatimonadota bacterium]
MRGMWGRRPALLIGASALAVAFASLLVGAVRGQPQREAGPDEGEDLRRLLDETHWAYQYEGGGIFRVPMEGSPDVWVHTSGDYVAVRAIVRDLPAPESLTVRQLMDLLERNFEVYQGKFGLDKERTLWFEVYMPKRLIDARELESDILYVAQAAKAEQKRAPQEEGGM